MGLYIVQFYDQNESGNARHNEVYTTYKAACRRYDYLKKHLNGYSWAYLHAAKITFGRVRCGECLAECSACYGDDDYYHGDDSDF